MSHLSHLHPREYTFFMSGGLDYENIANRAHNNALDLFSDAQLLMKNNRFPRAFFLACLSLEELGKSQITLDYINGNTAKKTFDEVFVGKKAHIIKLAYQLRWMELNANDGKLSTTIKYDSEKAEKLQELKNQAVYEHKNKGIEQDWKTQAEDLILFVNSWFDDIFHAEWLNSPKRGSKALYK